MHVLVIPKEHYADVATLAQADPALAGEVLAAAAAVAEQEGLLGDGFRLIFNTGRVRRPGGRSTCTRTCSAASRSARCSAR